MGGLLGCHLVAPVPCPAEGTRATQQTLLVRAKQLAWQGVLFIDHLPEAQLEAQLCLEGCRESMS
jgi:hypothetical protein